MGFPWRNISGSKSAFIEVLCCESVRHLMDGCSSQGALAAEGLPSPQIKGLF